MAADGLAPTQHMDAQGKLLRLSPGFALDLVDLG